MSKIINKKDFPEYNFTSKASSYKMELSIVNGDIVFVTISGIAVYEEFLKAQVLLNKFINEQIIKNKTYYLFNNHENLIEIPTKMRISYKKWVLNHLNIFENVFFFNLNNISQLIYKIGKTTTSLFDKIYIVKSVNEALLFIDKQKKISYLSDINLKFTDQLYDILLKKNIDEKKEWNGNIDNGRLIYSSIVIDGNIIVRKLEGVFHKGDMKYLIDSHNIIKNDMGIDENKYFLFLDLHKLVGIKIHSRTEAVDWFTSEVSQFYISGFFGADNIARLIIKYSISISSLKSLIFLYSNINQVLEIAFVKKGYISNIKQKNNTIYFNNLFNKSRRIKELEKENALLIESNSDRIEKILQIIGDITWNENLKPPNVHINDLDPFSDVFSSLKLLYFDVKEIIDNRDNLLEKAKESDALKSAFLANLSHEIRTPLNGIIGFTDLLLEEDNLKVNQEKFLKIISKNSNNLLSLMNDIIQTSTIEAGQVTIKNKKFDLNNLLAQLEDMFKSIVIKDKSTVEVECVTIFNNEFFITSDELKINQVLTNIIGNAIKFTDKGNVLFGYSNVSQNDVDYIKFFVKDTGIGIDKDKQEMIFERFRQIDESDTRSYGGAGLGLSISNNLVELLGGKIWIESEIGKGSVFYFTIPRI